MSLSDTVKTLAEASDDDDFAGRRKRRAARKTVKNFVESDSEDEEEEIIRGNRKKKRKKQEDSDNDFKVDEDDAGECLQPEITKKKTNKFLFDFTITSESIMLQFLLFKDFSFRSFI